MAMTLLPWCSPWSVNWREQEWRRINETFACVPRLALAAHVYLMLHGGYHLENLPG